MTKTKIICTIGPASASPQVLRQLLRAGMRVARLNFSHGTHDEYRRIIKDIRRAAASVGVPVAILQDLQGPRIRVGEFSGSITLKKRQTVVLLPQSDYHHSAHEKYVLVPMHYPLYRFVHAGHHIFLKDGTIVLLVERKNGHKLFCRVARGGTVVAHQGMNVPDTALPGSVITQKDKDDLTFGIAQGVDAVAFSFVRNHRDILQLRRLLPKSSRIKIIAKIERREAVENFSQILRVSDGIMIARGDLGVELSPEDVPLLQKELALDCLLAGVPVIVATQMLESMIHAPAPTRAEAADVANAVIDHADALMLSGETALGEYPVEAVRAMRRVVSETERSRYDDLAANTFDHRPLTPQHGIAAAAVNMASSSRAKCIVVLTSDGKRITELTQLRPQGARIIVMTTHPTVQNFCALLWGVEAVLVKKRPATMDAFASHARRILLSKKIAKKGEHVVLVYGWDRRLPWQTRALRQDVV